MTKPTVGIIGLGAMGAGIAKTLRNNGFTIHVCDVRPGVADAFVADGGTAHATTAALAAVSDVVVSVVVNAAQTESVLFGDDGKGGAASAMRPVSTFVMCSTVDPNWSVALEARLNALGLHYVDAPISGGAAKAASGQMTMMTSAKPEAYAAAGAPPAPPTSSGPRWSTSQTCCRGAWRWLHRPCRRRQTARSRFARR